MSTLRLTIAQALVRFLAAQRGVVAAASPRQRISG
jgi:TPP-dependent trihydroxycyclohexane-1,2-dione (THcHDO) dehydratase